MALSIAIISEFNGAGIQKAVKEFRNLETSSQRANYAIRKAAVPATAAIAAIAVGLGQAAKAAIADQKSQQLLATQLQNTTNATDDQIKANEDFVKQMMYASGVADDVLRPSLGSLVRATGDVQQAQKLLTLALDVSAGSGRSLQSVTTALARAQQGQFTALTRLGIPLDQNIIKTKDFSAATDVLAKTFGGAAAASANTLEGRMRILKLRLDETKEAIGTALLPVIEQFLPLLVSMAKFAERNAALIGAVTAALGLFAGVIVGARLALAAWKAVSVITTGINYALATSFTAVQVATGVGIATALAGAAAFVIIKKKMDAARDAANGYEKALNPVIDSQAALNNFVGPVATRDFKKFGTSVTDTIPTLKDLNKEQQKTADAAKKIRDAVNDAKEALRKDMADALDKAKAKLDDAQSAFDEFGASVGKSLTDAFSFKDAFDAGQETSTGFLKGLTDQATSIKKFGSLVKRLLSAGLSERALQQVLDAGVDTGTAIAEELLNGAGAILEANKLTAEIDALAKDVGLEASNKFYKAGVDAAAAMLKGVQDAVAAAELKLLAPNLTVGDVKGIGAGFGQAVNPDPFLSEFDAWVRNGMPGFSVEGIGVPMFGNGGIVTQPTLGVIGEAGPEAIIPLNQMGNMGGTSVTINVHGGDPNAVVNALRTYMRQNGSVPIKVSNAY